MQENRKTQKKRTKYEIIYNMLSVASEGAKKTWLMYKSNLSYEEYKKYLNLLLEKDLMYQDNKTRLFFLTEKGLILYNELQQYISVQDRLNEHLIKIKDLLGE